VHVRASHFQIRNSDYLLFSAVADIDGITSAFSLASLLPSPLRGLSLAGATIRPPPSFSLIQPVDGGCQTRQMAAERVTEARVTDVCPYARKRDARKLLVLARCDWTCRWARDAPASCGIRGLAFFSFAHKLGKKTSALTPDRRYVRLPFCFF